jgi:hypothetical protein
LRNCSTSITQRKCGRAAGKRAWISFRKTHASSGSPSETAALNPVCPSFLWRYAGSIFSARDEPKTSSSGARVSFATRRALTGLSVGMSVGKAPVPNPPYGSTTALKARTPSRSAPAAASVATTKRRGLPAAPSIAGGSSSRRNVSKSALSRARGD